MRILHLSDTHVPGGVGPDGDGVDARAALAQLLQDCRHLSGIDLVVVSGDIADDGSPEAYAAVQALVGGFARERHAGQVYCPGNHDDRAAFAGTLGSGHLDANGGDAGLLGCSSDERAAVSVVSGVRVITLDSLVPGQTSGRISDRQLRWLGDLLAQPSPRGSVVILHHPPIALDRIGQRRAGLQNPAALSAALDGSDVQVVLCGHFHAQITGRLGPVPVWIGPGVYSRLDLSAPDGLDRAVRGGAATVVDLAGAHAPMFHVVHARDPQAGQQVYLADSLTQQDVDIEQARDSPALRFDSASSTSQEVTG